VPFSTTANYNQKDSAAMLIALMLCTVACSAVGLPGGTASLLAMIGQALLDILINKLYKILHCTRSYSAAHYINV
jgi:4-hydroxybenzoate polyprenyltransferase